MKLKSLIPYILLLIPVFAIAQQPEYPDSGFTNKAEAKNLTINGLKEGKWCEYCDSAEKDTSSPYYMLIVYRKGKANGITWGYYKNGKLMLKLPYTNGLLNGVEKKYYQGGQLMGEATYSDGILIGTVYNYYENGKLKSETTNFNSVKAETKNYDENGNEIKL